MSTPEQCKYWPRPRPTSNFGELTAVLSRHLTGFLNAPLFGGEGEERK